MSHPDPTKDYEEEDPDLQISRKDEDEIVMSSIYIANKFRYFYRMGIIQGMEVAERIRKETQGKYGR